VWRSVCGVMPSGSGLRVALGLDLLGAADDRLDHVLAEVVARARPLRGGHEHGVIRAGAAACDLVPSSPQQPWAQGDGQKPPALPVSPIAP
jgi:hypothetical protein